MTRNIKEEFNEHDSSSIEDANEYVQYAISTERTLHKVQKILNEDREAKKTALEIMKVATEFYDADWCGILDVNAEVGVWAPLWWYDSLRGEMSPTNFYEFESSEGCGRWIQCLKNQEEFLILDIEGVKEEYPEEYPLFQRLGIESVVGVPFWKGNCQGFLVLRNPKKYKQYTSFLRMLSQAIVSCLTEHYIQEASKLLITSPRVKTDKDVYISLFGELEITTSKGILTERELKSAKQAKLIAYLILNKRAAVTPRELAEILWEDEDVENAVKNMKGLVYRLQQAFSLISDYRLIESTTNGYQLNLELNIITDCQIFDNNWNLAAITTDTKQRIYALKEAVDLYTGALLKNYRQEHWLMATAVACEYRYVGVFGELMKFLEEQHDYVCIQNYAANAMKVVPHNIDVYYWLIHSMNRMNRMEMSRNIQRMAQSDLLEEEYEELIRRLNDGEGVVKFMQRTVNEPPKTAKAL